MTKCPSLKLHHLGILVEDIEACSRHYEESLGYEIRSHIIHDPLQRAYVRFLSLPCDTMYLELVAPDSPQSFLHNALKRAPGLNHICFSTASIEGSIRHLNSLGAMVLHPPVPAIAFGNRKIAWLMDIHCILVELVEGITDEGLDFHL